MTLSGGLQDAYSYCVRGGVFANAQTGNIILMSQRFFDGDWGGGLWFLIPLLSFVCGIFVAEQVRARYKRLRTVHWRQPIVLGEIVLLFAVGFVPSSLDFIANALVSFSCAMQVQTFRKMKGCAYASTMCVGNLRSGTASFSAYLRTRDPALLKKAGQYFGGIVLFALGAGGGCRLAALWGQRTIWVCCGLLFVSFALMFIREDGAEVPDTPRAAIRELRLDAAHAEICTGVEELRKKERMQA